MGRESLWRYLAIYVGMVIWQGRTHLQLVTEYAQKQRVFERYSGKDPRMLRVDCMCGNTNEWMPVFLTLLWWPWPSRTPTVTAYWRDRSTWRAACCMPCEWRRVAALGHLAWFGRAVVSLAANRISRLRSHPAIIKDPIRHTHKKKLPVLGQVLGMYIQRLQTRQQRRCVCDRRAHTSLQPKGFGPRLGRHK
jgi:hypothetical protein